MGKFVEKPPSFLAAHSTEVRESGYKFINPLLECESSEKYFTELTPFKDKLLSYAKKINQDSDKVNFLSLYFRDLNNGPWFGVNEEEVFSPASLLKVPIMIVYFKVAETHPEILQKTYVFEDDGMLPAVEQSVSPSQVLEIGKAYSVDDLIHRMIIYSDNRAQHLLVKNMDLDTLKKVYGDFELNIPDKEKPETLVTVKDYASFFRILFNSSYLSKTYSEKALNLLSQVEYKDGLVAGLPSNMVVAHKFGERQKLGDSARQLHDCGIVYYPQHPYLICVMTRGNNNQKLSETIKEASRLVYEEVDNQYR